MYRVVVQEAERCCSEGNLRKEQCYVEDGVNGESLYGLRWGGEIKSGREACAN